jgi:hypothetical protein
MTDAQFDRLHEKIDAHLMEVGRFHEDVANVTRQIANFDRLVKLANSSLGQINEKIVDAAQISAQAEQIADNAAIQAGHAATEAASAAVNELVGAMAGATEAARQTAARLDVLQLKTGWWIAFYAGLTLLCCLVTGFITSWALRGSAVTPEQAHYIELGKAHETLLGNASDKELKTINAIRARQSKAK